MSHELGLVRFEFLMTPPGSSAHTRVDESKLKELAVAKKKLVGK